MGSKWGLVDRRGMPLCGGIGVLWEQQTTPSPHSLSSSMPSILQTPVLWPVGRNRHLGESWQGNFAHADVTPRAFLRSNFIVHHFTVARG